MASLDVEETINISCDSLFGNEARINNFSRYDFEIVLRIALENNFFNLYGKIYKETDGEVMGSALVLSVVNAFLCFHEQIWLNHFLDNFKPAFYRWMRYFRYFVHLTILKNLQII